MKLVSVICESLAREPLKKLLREVGARGYTVAEVQGAGAKGERTGEMLEFGNIKLEVIVPAAVCDELMGRLEREFFPRYAIVAYETDIRVRRGSKF